MVTAGETLIVGVLGVVGVATGESFIVIVDMGVATGVRVGLARFELIIAVVE